MDIKKVLDELAKRRPVFHSEADCQFELAWEIKSTYDDASIRLEYPYRLLGLGNDPTRNDKYLDLIVKIDSSKFLIELKYLTRQAEISVKDEKFLLRTHAQNLRSYDVLRDLERLERACAIEACLGYVVVLSNDKYYKQEPENRPDHAEFSIHQGRKIDGTRNDGAILNWQNPARNDRRGPISLYGTYHFDWGCFGNGKYSFCHLIIPVCGRRQQSVPIT